MQTAGSSYKLYDDPWKFYDAMLHDIEQAKKYVFIETYKFGSGNIGERFKNVLTNKAKQGVEIKLLVDSWGTSVSTSFFEEMIKFGGEIRFFQKIRFFIDFFTKNHRRNHRKIIVIDDKLSYIGSANIAGHSLNWRESVLRMESPITRSLKKVFLEDFQNYNRYVFNKSSYTRVIKQDGFEIIRDVPSIRKQRVKKRYEYLIKKAQSSVFIETPYFLPGFMLRKVLVNASRRGIDINIIIPKHSDIGLVDVIRNRYLGLLYKNKVKIWYFIPCNLHAKIVLVDNNVFCIGSSNFDYRSFRYQHEIMLQGSQEPILKLVKDHISDTLLNSEIFDYDEWHNRPFIQRLIENIFIPFRHLF